MIKTTYLILTGLMLAVSSVSADDDLILHYTFEQGSGKVVQDRSGHGHEGVIHGDASWTSGTFGKAIRFDGIDDFIQCAPTPLLNTQDEFTVETWVYIEKNVGGIFSRHTSGSWIDERLIMAMFERKMSSGNRHYLSTIADGKFHLITRSPPPPLGRWTHLAITFDGSLVRMYRDGILENKNHAARSIIPQLKDVPIYIGLSKGIGPDPFFKGLISEVRYYKRALSGKEINKHRNSGWQKLREVIIAKRTSASPKLDGILDEPMWQAAADHHIPTLASTVPPKGTKTQVRVAYDDQHLYIAFDCEEKASAKIEQLLSDKPRRKGVIWNFDLIEVFLDPDLTRQRYYHLAASPVEHQTYDDKTGFDGGAGQDESWHQPWSCASHIDKTAKRWTMEMVIPFTSLNTKPPKAGDIWLANFSRQRPEGWQTEPHLYLWSQLEPGFNDPFTFGALCFEQGSPQVAQLIHKGQLKNKSTATGWADSKTPTVGIRKDGSAIVPTGQTITAAGQSITFDGRPIDMALSPDGQWLVVTTTYQAILIHTTQGIKHKLRLPSGSGNSLHGILFTPDSKNVYLAGHRGQVELLRITKEGKLKLDTQRKLWKSSVCGMTYSKDGDYAYIAASVSNRLLITDGTLENELTSIRVGVAPYSVVLGPNDKIYVSNWGGRKPAKDEPTGRTNGGSVVVNPETGIPTNGTISVLQGRGRALKMLNTIDVGRFPCQLILNADKSRLFSPNANDDTLSVIDTADDKVVETINVKPDARLPFGSQPVAQVLSPDGQTLYVANATNNAIAGIKLGRLAGGDPTRERSALIGLIPVGWFPGAIHISQDGKQLYVANVRGLGAESQPIGSGKNVSNFLGLVNIIDIPDDKSLAAYSKQVADNNRQQTALLHHRPRKENDKLVPIPTKPGESSVFEHVIYIVRENHTYDQDLGDMPEGNGEPRLCSSGIKFTPNAHAIAKQFVLLDNYHVPSVQSPSGHQWISQAIVTSYWEKALNTWPRRYSYTNSDALALAPSGFIWDNVMNHGLTFRNYGEGVSWNVKWSDPNRKDPLTFTDVWKDFNKRGNAVRIKATPSLANLIPYTHPNFPGYGYLCTDVQRAQIFIDDLKKFEQEGNMPNMTWILLPNNHTSGSRAGYPTAPAQIADNDMALGMVVDAVSKSKFWPKTVIFCIEDDPVNGSDHVAGSRSLCYVVSPYTKRKAVVSKLYTLTGLIKTIEMILGLPMMNQLDLMGTPMHECFTDTPDFTPYTHLKSNLPLDKLNPQVSELKGAARYWAQKSAEMPLMEEPDAFPGQFDVFRRIAWYTTMGYDTPFTYINDDGLLVREPVDAYKTAQ